MTYQKLTIYSRKISRYASSTIIVILLKTIINCFNSSTSNFKELLLHCGYHPAIVNNPFIVLEKANTKSNKIYISSWTKFILNMFSFSIRKGYWNAPRRQKLLKYVGFNRHYIYNVDLFLKDFTYPYYNEIKIPINKIIPEGKKVIYSVMIGGYDEVFDPLYISEDCEYILFTDNLNLKTNVWKLYPIKLNNEYSLKWNVLYYKTLANKVLPEVYDLSIYIDSSITICGDISQLFRYLDEDHPLVMFKNYSNQSLLDEVEGMKKLKWVPSIKADEVYNNYISDGFPDNLGQIESGVLIRKHKDKRVCIIMDKWMEEFTKYPYRDQFNIMYSIWKTNSCNYYIIDSYLWDNQFFFHRKKDHKKKRNIYN